MVGRKPKYTPEETAIAIEKGMLFVTVLSQNQRNYLLGTLLGLFIADGEYENINHMVSKVKSTVR